MQDKNICRSNQSKQPTETFGPNKHPQYEQSMQQQRAYPQRNEEESNQVTIIVPDTQERDDATSKDQYFLFQGPNQTDWRE